VMLNSLARVSSSFKDIGDRYTSTGRPKFVLG
jgi:hypothetical protein